MEEWLPERHLARFVVEVIEQLDLSAFVKAYRGSGSASYHPSMLLGLLVYGYATGVFSSRKLERATYDSVAFPLHRGQRSSRPRYHRRVPAAFSRPDRRAVRRGAAAGPGSRGAEARHGGAGRRQGARQREPAQRAVVETRLRARSPVEGRGGGVDGVGGGGRWGGCARRDVGARGTGPARGSSGPHRRGQGGDRGAGARTP